jgi:peptide/nickel transport system ATP-binding protein
VSQQTHIFHSEQCLQTLQLAFIGYDLSIIHRLCTHVLVLHHDKIAEEGETSTLFDNP